MQPFAQEKEGFVYSVTLARGIPSPKHPGALELRTPGVMKTTRRLNHFFIV
jgi:hypothetical protein